MESIKIEQQKESKVKALKSKMSDRRKSKKEEQEDTVSRFNRVSKPTNFILNIIFALISAACIIPFIFVLIISFTSEDYIKTNGYSFLPKEWSFEAYEYIFSSSASIINSYGITIFVTVTGTVLGVLVMAMFAYAISRRSFAYRGFFTKLIFIPMLFSGGMVSSYLVITKFLGLKNSLLALILPICVSSFNIIILRTFFKTSVPEAILESAKIDGAGDFTIFMKVILPLVKPALATIGMFIALGYWNDWYNSMLFINNENLYSLQYYLYKIVNNIEAYKTILAQAGGGTSLGSTINMPSESLKMALTIIVTGPIILVYPFIQKYFVSGVTIGAVKG